MFIDKEKVIFRIAMLTTETTSGASSCYAKNYWSNVGTLKYVRYSYSLLY